MSARLKALKDQGLIERRSYSDHPPRAEYLLTAQGRTLGPLLRALHDWGARHGRPGRRSGTNQAR